MKSRLFLFRSGADPYAVPRYALLSRSIWTIDHIYPVARRGFPDHLRRCPSEFDILPIGSLAGNAPVGDAKADIAAFVGSAHGQLDRQLQCQEAHECLLDVLESLNRLPWLGDEYTLVIVELQQGAQVARVESLLKGRIHVSGLHRQRRIHGERLCGYAHCSKKAGTKKESSAVHLIYLPLVPVTQAH